MAGLEQITARRAWFVPDFMVWGIPGLGDLDYLAVEQIGSESSIYFGKADIEGGPQEVAFNQLVDHRGNTLPAVIKAPRIFPRPRGPESVYIVGAESGSTFQIARDGSASGPILTDLLIVEMGD